MPTTADSIQKMITSHFNGNDEDFKIAVKEYIAEEKRKKNHVLARELERVLSKVNGNGAGRSEVLTLLGLQGDDLPRDKDKAVVLVEVSEAARRLDDLILKPQVRSLLNKLVEENKRRDLLGAYGMKPISKVLFCGPPGCGKTMAAEAVAKALYLPLTTVRFDAVVSSYLGETASNLRKVFDFARTRPMALFFDEFDAIGKHRTSEDEHGELKRVVNSFLQLLDSFRGEALTIAATNHQGLLDPAIWRRFDEIVLFSPPEKEEIIKLYSKYFHQIGLSQAVNLETYAEKSAGMSHADIERIANDAIKQTILEGGERIEPGILSSALARQASRLQITSGSAENRKKGETIKSPRAKRT